MINVLASIHVKTGRRSDFVKIFKANMPLVRAEKGCIEYFPAVDIDAKLSRQVLDENSVTIIEKWESLEALHAHLKAPHMLAYREKVKDIVESSALKILQEA
jgi:quinol monooxygenase YgiN